MIDSQTNLLNAADAHCFSSCDSGLEMSRSISQRDLTLSTWADKLTYPAHSGASWSIDRPILEWSSFSSAHCSVAFLRAASNSAATEGVGWACFFSSNFSFLSQYFLILRCRFLRFGHSSSYSLSRASTAICTSAELFSSMVFSSVVVVDAAAESSIGSAGGSGKTAGAVCVLLPSSLVISAILRFRWVLGGDVVRISQGNSTASFLDVYASFWKSCEKMNAYLVLRTLRDAR